MSYADIKYDGKIDSVHDCIELQSDPELINDWRMSGVRLLIPTSANCLSQKMSPLVITTPMIEFHRESKGVK